MAKIELKDGECQSLEFRSSYTGLVVVLAFKLPNQPYDLVQVAGRSLSRLAWGVIVLGVKQGSSLAETNEVLESVPSVLRQHKEDFLIERLWQKIESLA